ncbi:hypothetical protein DFH09DRAFT_1367794 [Mycena vulgaris]|nr:hypothetical protein DFH09DRAFT_1367794 [Mycena vulgaris]
MASVTALNARIQELSLAIEPHRQVLLDLEQQKSDAQRDVNAILDPMARLPFEISSYIFTQCLPTILQPDPFSAPILLLKICRLWTNIALPPPRCGPGSRSNFLGNVGSSTFLTPGSNVLGAIRPRSPSVDDCPQAVAVVLQHAVQVQNLELYLWSGEILHQILGSWSSLKTLTIAQDDRDPIP